MNIKRMVFLGTLLLCFGLGWYVWKIRHTGALFWHSASEELSVEDLDFTVYVGNYLITRDEIDWEYKYYHRQMSIAETGSQAEAIDPEKPVDPKPEPAPTKPNLELYNKILADLIERKLLYQYIENDKRFNMKEPSRYTSCVQTWANTSDQLRDFFKDEMDKSRLKSMLCERDILLQYIQERIVASVHFGEEELREYFGTHRHEFVEPPKVVIRQIVVGSENEAKRVSAKVNSANFAEMAKELSIAPEAKNGGLLGPFTKGDLPSFFDIAFEMKQGAIEGVLKSPYGFHILMLEKKLPRIELRYEAAREKIIASLTQKRRDEDYRKWVESALNSIPIKSSRPF